MANPEHLDLLDEGAAKWNRWREQEPELVPDLTGAKLSMADLAGFDLRSCRLTGAILRRADLGSSLLCEADLTGADLSFAYLGQADLGRGLMAGAAINTEPGTLLWLRVSDLSAATIVKADLSGAYLRGARLRHANLQKSRLESTFLFAADLRSAQLQEANLDGADLSVANLAGASLANSNLAAVNFWGARFKDTDLSSARLMCTILAQVDLSGIIGLDSVRHDGPSTIDIDTLIRTGGALSSSFLRACGLSDEFINKNRDLISRSEQFYSCFISYSHVDRSFACRLYEQLQARGIRCWLDKKDMKPGERITDSVNEAIRRHDISILCCSEASLRSRWVKDEIRNAHELERELGRDIIIPLNLDGYLLAWQDGLAADLRSRLAADFTDWESDEMKFGEQFELVLRALRPEKKPKA